MIQPTVVAAALAVIGGVVAVTARDSRFVALGLFVAMAAALLASSPEPTALVVVFRILGGLLAAYLLWAGARARSIESEGSGSGAAAEILVAAAAFSVGWFVVPVKPLAGPLATQAAGISLAALAVVPLAGRNVLRVGTGFVLLLLGISMLLEAWVGPATSLRQVVLTALLVGVVGATRLLISPIEPAKAADDGAGSVVPGAGDVGLAPPAVAEAADDVPEASPAPAPQVTPVKSRARHLHPREPREPNR